MLGETLFFGGAVPSRSERAGRERGVVMVLFAISVLMLIAIAALVVDLGLLYSTKARLQTAADAAVFAAAEELPSPVLVETTAVQYAHCRNDMSQWVRKPTTCRLPSS